MYNPLNARAWDYLFQTEVTLGRQKKTDIKTENLPIKKVSKCRLSNPKTQIQNKRSRKFRGFKNIGKINLTNSIKSKKVCSDFVTYDSRICRIATKSGHTCQICHKFDAFFDRWIGASGTNSSVKLIWQIPSNQKKCAQILSLATVGSVGLRQNLGTLSNLSQIWCFFWPMNWCLSD